VDREFIDAGYPRIIKYPTGYIFCTAHATVISHIAYLDTNMSCINSFNIDRIYGDDKKGKSKGRKWFYDASWFEPTVLILVAVPFKEPHEYGYYGKYQQEKY
jgi:hypothetical protein